MTVARSCHDILMNKLMEFYQSKLLSKEDIAITLCAHKAANDKGKSEPREYADSCHDLRETILIHWKTNTGSVPL